MNFCIKKIINMFRQNNNSNSDANQPEPGENYKDYFEPEDEFDEVKDSEKKEPQPETEEERENRELKEQIIERSRRMRKIKIGLCVGIVVCAIAILVWLYMFLFVPTVQGMKAGRVVSVELKGTIKNFYGVMFENVYVADSILCFYGDKFEFSVPTDSVAHKLMRASVSNKRAIVSYSRYHTSLPFFRSECVVDSVVAIEPLGKVMLEPVVEPE